ncbi:SAF domain-containing protein [Virgibacillus sp. W0181]|uniref:SAF domain-containing protein n=1 Tax=Virgibacillus sp. W0181 TaxID=3391581 RepID=UPI003F45BE93
MGSVSYGPTKAEKESLQFRRSIYTSKDIKIGDKFTSDNIRIVRPGYGLKPKHYKSLLGKESQKEFKFGDRITFL